MLKTGLRTARRAAEMLSRGVVLQRRLPDDFDCQPIFVTPDASLRYWRRDLEKVEPDLFRWVREFVQPGFCVWDIGANCGLFTFPAAQRVGGEGLVVSVEPDLWLVTILRRSARCLSAESGPVEILPCAVTGRTEVVMFQVARRGRASNYVAGYGRSQADGPRESHSLVAVSLDWLGTEYRKPDVIKIDVEGAEVEVLRGGRRTLAEARPTVICEVGGDAIPQVTQIFRDSGYRLYDLAEPTDRRRPLESAVWETLAVPR